MKYSQVKLGLEDYKRLSKGWKHFSYLLFQVLIAEALLRSTQTSKMKSFAIIITRF